MREFRNEMTTDYREQRTNGKNPHSLFERDSIRVDLTFPTASLQKNRRCIILDEIENASLHPSIKLNCSGSQKQNTRVCETHSEDRS
jgi:hypothetical protein